MSTLVFIEFNKNIISESSSQAATIANELKNEVYGLTSNDDETFRTMAFIVKDQKLKVKEL